MCFFHSFLKRKITLRIKHQRRSVHMWSNEMRTYGTFISENGAFFSLARFYFLCATYRKCERVHVERTMYTAHTQWSVDWIWAMFCENGATLICWNRHNQLIRVAWIGQSHWTKSMFYTHIRDWYYERCAQGHRFFFAAVVVVVVMLVFRFISFICRFFFVIVFIL